MLSIFTLHWQVTKIVMSSGSQLSELGNNFKNVRNWRPQMPPKQNQQSFKIVDMSNIHGKHVHRIKTWRNLIWGIVFFQQKLRQLQTFLKLLPNCNHCHKCHKSFGLSCCHCVGLCQQIKNKLTWIVASWQMCQKIKIIKLSIFSQILKIGQNCKNSPKTVKCLKTVKMLVRSC